MDDLSPRQIELLKAIILEYTEIGDAVGSDILDKKYKLGVSPATIRNDMVVLAKNEKGYHNLIKLVSKEGILLVRTSPNSKSI